MLWSIPSIRPEARPSMSMINTLSWSSPNPNHRVQIKVTPLTTGQPTSISHHPGNY
jgi:hypothetical protein